MLKTPTFKINKTEDVARAWATQDRPHAKAASASFRGKELFSYGTRIGFVMPDRALALVTSHSYSNSTAVVVGQARTAAKEAGLKVFTVPGAVADHSINVAHYTAAITERLGKVENALKPDGHRAMAVAVLKEQTDYIKAFALVGAEPDYTARQIAGTKSRKEREA